MADKINVCIIGAGNISNTRHIPSLKRLKSKVNIVGIISDKEKNIKRTQDKWHIKNTLLLSGDYKKDLELLKNCEWFKDVDAVAIGTPPHKHYSTVKLALTMNKHTLVEKPMMMNKKECDEMIELAKKQKKQFAVMHNFQFARQMQKLTEIIDSKEYGNIVSVTEVQFTNKDRRLPEWYNELPLGLFYDEAAHFIYLLQRHCGEIKVVNACKIDDNPKVATPLTLNADCVAGKVPVHMMLNFNSPICEWYYIVNFKKCLFVYDFFKDILIKVNTDNQHLSKDILKNDFKYTFDYWGKFVGNGFRMISGNLLYGQEVVFEKYINGILTGKYDKDIQAEKGRETVIAMNDIVNEALK